MMLSVMNQLSVKMITVSFSHNQKKRNEGFEYNISNIYWDIFSIYRGQIFKKAVANGKKQYLKNWNLKGKCRIENMGKKHRKQASCYCM